jgi:hypothetical protein
MDAIGKEFMFRKFFGAVPATVDSVMLKFQKDGYYTQINLDSKKGLFLIKLQKEYYEEIRLKTDNVLQGLWLAGILSKLNDFSELSVKIQDRKSAGMKSIK